MSQEETQLQDVATAPAEIAVEGPRPQPNFKLSVDSKEFERIKAEATKSPAKQEEPSTEDDPAVGKDELAKALGKDKPKEGKKPKEDQIDLDPEPEEAGDLEFTDSDEPTVDWEARVKEIEAQLSEKESEIAKLASENETLKNLVDQVQSVHDVYDLLPKPEQAVFELRLGVDPNNEQEASLVSNFLSWRSAVPTLSDEQKLYNAYRFALRSRDPHATQAEIDDKASQALNAKIRYAEEENGGKFDIDALELIKSFERNVFSGEAFGINPKEIADRGRERLNMAGKFRKEAEEMIKEGMKNAEQAKKLLEKHIAAFSKYAESPKLGRFIPQNVSAESKKQLAAVGAEVKDLYERGELMQSIFYNDKGELDVEKVNFIYMQFGPNAKFNKYAQSIQNAKLKPLVDKAVAEELTAKMNLNQNPSKNTRHEAPVTTPQNKQLDPEKLKDQSYMRQARITLSQPPR